MHGHGPHAWHQSIWIWRLGAQLCQPARLRGAIARKGQSKQPAVWHTPFSGTFAIPFIDAKSFNCALSIRTSIDRSRRHSLLAIEERQVCFKEIPPVSHGSNSFIVVRCCLSEGPLAVPCARSWACSSSRVCTLYVSARVLQLQRSSSGSTTARHLFKRNSNWASSCAAFAVPHFSHHI